MLTKWESYGIIRYKLNKALKFKREFWENGMVIQTGIFTAITHPAKKLNCVQFADCVQCIIMQYAKSVPKLW